MSSTHPSHAYKKQTALIVVNVLLFGACVYTAYLARIEMLYVTGIMLAVSIAPHILKRSFNFYVPMFFVYAAVIFIYLTIGLGQFEQFYETYHWWDSIMHFASAIVLGIIGFLILYLFYAAGKLNLPKWLIALFGCAFAISIGAIWEIVEFIIDNILGTNLQVNSLNDTMWDLTLDVAGAIFGMIAGYLYLLRIPIPIIDGVVEEFTQENKTTITQISTEPDTDNAPTQL